MRKIEQIMPIDGGENGYHLEGPVYYGAPQSDGTIFIQGMALIEEEDGSTSLEWIAVEGRSRNISVTCGYFQGIDE